MLIVCFDFIYMAKSQVKIETLFMEIQKKKQKKKKVLPLNILFK